METKNKTAAGFVFVVLSGLFLIPMGYYSLTVNLYRLNVINKIYVHFLAILIGILLVKGVISLAEAANKSGKNSKIKLDRIFDSMILLALLVFEGIRMFYISRAPGDLGDMEQVFRAVGKKGKFIWNISNVDGIYSTVLSAVGRYYGKTETSLIMCQMILSLVACIFVFLGIYLLAGKVSAIVAILWLSALEGFAGMILTTDYTAVEIVLFGLGLIALGMLKRLSKYVEFYEILLALVSFFVGVLCLYSSINIPLAFGLLFMIADSGSITVYRRILDVPLGFLICMSGFLFNIIQAKIIYGTGYSFWESVWKFAAYRFDFEFSLKALASFADSGYGLIFIILCLAYIVVFFKCKNTSGCELLYILFFSILFVVFYENSIKNYDSYYIVMAIIMLGLGAEAIAIISSGNRISVIKERISKKEPAKQEESNGEEVELFLIPKDVKIPVVTEKAQESYSGEPYSEDEVLSVSDILAAQKKAKGISDVETAESDSMGPENRKAADLDDYDITEFSDDLMKYDLE